MCMTCICLMLTLLTFGSIKLKNMIYNIQYLLKLQGFFTANNLDWSKFLLYFFIFEVPTLYLASSSFHFLQH